MLMNGTEYLESLRNGRTIRIGSESAHDVKTYPAFRNAALSPAGIRSTSASTWGPAFVVRDHVRRETDWEEVLGYVDGLLESYGAPGKRQGGAG